MIGNYSNDILDNEYVQKRGFGYEFSLFQMKRNLEKEIQAVDKPNGEVEIREWKVKEEEEEQMYLRANNRIWPDAPLNLSRLREAKSNSLWRTFTAFVNNEIIGSVMVWKDDRNAGVTEDVFVLEEWRGKGLAKYLVTKALRFLHDRGISEVFLEVEAKNSTALKLYHSLGYEVVHEQHRYSMEI